VVVVAVPEPLSAAVFTPIAPGEVANQRDVADLILQYDTALRQCNGQLAAIRLLGEEDGAP
jgi:hypothetical protein